MRASKASPTRAFRSWIIVLLALGAVVSACGTTEAPSIEAPSIIAPSPSSATPTPSLDASVPPSLTESPPITGAELRPIADAPLAAADINGISTTPTGFVIHGVMGEARAQLVLLGSDDGQTWTRLDASSFGTEFTDIAAGPLGWVADQRIATGQGVGVGTVLWFSTDGRTWQQLPDQAGLGESFEGPLAVGPLGFAMIGQVVVAGTSISALWTSHDGRVWSEVESLREVGLDRIVITESAFVGVRTGRNGARPSIWISTDGSTWTRPPTNSNSPVGREGTSITTPVEIGSEFLVVQGASLQGATDGPSPSVWLGTIDPAPEGTVITWQHEAAADALLVGAAVVTATAVPGGVALYGYDRATLAPLVWTSPDGKTWRRTDLAAGTFGGGVPDLIVRGERSVVAVWSAGGSNLLQTIPRVWRSEEGIAWTRVGGELLGALPTQPTESCPATQPTTVDAILAVDVKLAVACFGREALTIEGYVKGCGGCGGVDILFGSPAWLLNPSGYSAFWLSGTAESIELGGRGMGVWVNPARPVTVPPEGTHVAVTGHFDDPAAATCRLVPLVNLGVALPDPSDAVATCRRSFVASSIRVVTP